MLNKISWYFLVLKRPRCTRKTSIENKKSNTTKGKNQIRMMRSANQKKIFTEKMEKQNIEGRIAVKQKEVQVEQDPNRKRQLQNDLEILNMRKQIEIIKEKIKMKQHY